MKKLLFAVYLGAIIVGTTVMAMAATVSGNDSTHPGERPVPPIIEGSLVSAKFESNIKQTGDLINPYHEWVGSIIANAMRDPAFLATLDVTYQDFINFINSLDSADRQAFLGANNLPDNSNDEDLLQSEADVCLHCHTPAGWGKDYSELPIAAF